MRLHNSSTQGSPCAGEAQRITKDANRGWNRLNRGTTGGENGPAIQFNYVPDPTYESPVPVGANELNKAGRVYGYYKWTRGGLRGIDFGGGEIDTSGW